ncbi:MAG: TRAM domain-containing protein, partial [Candidatus Bathyarchaeia archaeon]
MAIVQKRSEVELEIQSTGEKGRGVGKLDGYVVFVKCAVPGDRLLVQIVKLKRNYAEAVPLRLLVPSPQRV